MSICGVLTAKGTPCQRRTLGPCLRHMTGYDPHRWDKQATDQALTLEHQLLQLRQNMLRDIETIDRTLALLKKVHGLGVKGAAAVVVCSEEMSVDLPPRQGGEDLRDLRQADSTG